MSFRDLLLAGAVLVATAPAAAADLLACARWPVSPVDVIEGGLLRARIPNRGLVTIRARGVDGPQRDGPCDIERFLAVLARSQTIVSLAKAGVVTFCAPTETDAGVVEATVLVDGVDLPRILADAKLAQPLDGSATIDWCAR